VAWFRWIVLAAKKIVTVCESCFRLSSGNKCQAYHLLIKYRHRLRFDLMVSEVRGGVSR